MFRCIHILSVPQCVEHLQGYDMISMTEKQYALLKYLREYMADKPVAPSYEEMMNHLEVTSKSGIHRLLSALEERNHIRRIPNRARAIELLGEK